VQPFVSVAVTVNDAEPELPLYVPLIRPLLEFNVIPLGSDPLVMLYVYGVAPPLADTVLL
jgi:hypothetical protein